SRIDRERYAARVAIGAQRLEQGQHAIELLLFGGRRGAGARRLAADVDDRGAVVEHLVGMVQRALAVGVAATVVERVRGDVEHAHHARPVERDPVPAANQVPGGELRQFYGTKPSVRPDWPMARRRGRYPDRTSCPAMR